MLKILALTFAAALALAATPALADPAQNGPWLHATSLIGDPKYPPDFPHYDYVNPDAPKGGTVRLSVMGSFDSFNPLPDKGEAAAALGLVYETLMDRSLDEASSEYGLLADAVAYPPDISSATFRMNPKAKWQDGTPVTADDVVWSFNETIKASAYQANYYHDVKQAKVTAPGEVTFYFDTTGNRELPNIMGQLMIFPEHWWEAKDANGKPRDITATTLEPPMGSGPYKLVSFNAGSDITYQRDPNYWGATEATAIGENNFDQIKYVYFRDDDVAFEGFKGDQFDWWDENRAKRWATAYDFPAAQDGRVIKELFPQQMAGSGVMVGFVPNLRGPKFQDERVREALNYAFDFESLNKTIFFNQYERINSYFYGTALASAGLPTGQELDILNSVKDKIPVSVFTTPYANPVGGDTTKLRANLKQALDLLSQAGYELELPSSGLSPLWFVGAAIVLAAIGLAFGGKRRLPVAAGGVVVAALAFGVYTLWLKPPTVTEATLVDSKTRTPFSFEILLDGPTIEPVAQSFVNNLKQIGITATIREVDSAQYINRERSRDFDMIYEAWGESLSPGNEQRDFWSCGAAKDQSTSNYGGICDPGVDALIDKVVFAKDRDTLIAATKALDRVLLAGHYVVPSYTLPSERIARWDRFGKPDHIPDYDIGFPTVWWWDAAKATKTGAPAS